MMIVVYGMAFGWYQASSGWHLQTCLGVQAKWRPNHGQTSLTVPPGFALRNGGEFVFMRFSGASRRPCSRRRFPRLAGVQLF